MIVRIALLGASLAGAGDETCSGGLGSMIVAVNKPLSGLGAAGAGGGAATTGGARTGAPAMGAAGTGAAGAGAPARPSGVSVPHCPQNRAASCTGCPQEEQKAEAIAIHHSTASARVWRLLECPCG